MIIFARLTLVSGLAPVVAPVLGGQLNRVLDWRGIFWRAGRVSGCCCCWPAPSACARACRPNAVASAVFPPPCQDSGGCSATVCSSRVIGAAGLAGASMFAYISGATFVLQRIYGLSPQGFSFVFGANSIGIMIMSQTGARLARRHHPSRMLAVGLTLNLLGATALAVTILAGLPLPFIVGSLFVMVSAVGLVLPTSSALAMADYPDLAGSASALLGLGQFVMGAVVAPLVGIAGQDTAVPLGLVAVSSSLCATLVFALVARPALAVVRSGQPIRIEVDHERSPLTSPKRPSGADVPGRRSTRCRCPTCWSGSPRSRPSRC